jgi:hypothetical protein
MKRSKTAVAVSAFLALGGLAHAQTAAPTQQQLDAAIEQLRKEARADVNTLITDAMRFSADDAAKFWPLYKAYEVKRTGLMDEKLTLIKDFAANYDTMTDAKAKQLMDGALASDEKAQAAKRQFLGELAKAFPAKTVARFAQVHNRIDLLVNLKIASEIPLLR